MSLLVFMETITKAAPERGRQQTLERIEYCLDLRPQRQARLAAWLACRGRRQGSAPAS